MKKIYSTLGPILTPILILLIIEFLASVIILRLTNHEASCFRYPKIAAYISTLYQITILATFLICIFHYILGIINYLHSLTVKKTHKNNTLTQKMLIRGSICLLILALFYLLIFYIANLYGIDYCNRGLPQF